MSSDSTPICRCRVLYLGSSVPQVTKDGLQGIQEPLQELYPEQGAIGARGIDSWLSVWSNGILLENVDENHKKITRFFPIESLHYCAAIRYVLVPEKNTLHSPSPRFLPLDSPFARAPNPSHPPLFAAILRRTTGIKVLECHAFICKREVAANALVRCCFHAYADSSYAKQVEGGNGSVYGTLNGKLSRPQSQAGSTMTINTVGNAKDDISIYNGDENHKVWAGSQDNLDAIYDVYSTSTLTRPARPRQIAQPVAVPPPPAPATKEKPKKKPKPTAGKANSISGIKSRGPPPHQPIYIMGGHPGITTTLPNPKFFKYHGNTYSHRGNKRMLIAPRAIPPPFIPISPVGPVVMSTTTLQTSPNNKKSKKNKMPAHLNLEEPVYITGTPPGIPMHHPEPYLIPHQHQYATMETPHRGAKRLNNKEIPSKQQQQLLSLRDKKLAKSMNGLDAMITNNDDPAVLNMSEESPFNTGIYRKKGHLNERAFSYSIRQEHRSRSYGSLANLKFATPLPNGGPPVPEVEDTREDMKKEREIMQMVQDLDLSGDEIERSEVPRGMYDLRGGAPLLGGPTVIVNGSRGHRR